MDIQIDISQTVLETDRLVLRAWKSSDLEDFYEYASVPGVGEMAGWKHHESIEASRKILDSFIAARDTFAVVFKQNNKVIGSLGLHVSKANDEELYENLAQKELGYVLSRDYWGMGLMPEAVGGAVRFCFEGLNLDAVSVFHFCVNAQSRRVIEKCGFRFIKFIDVYEPQLDKTFESRMYILLKQDWNSRNV